MKLVELLKSENYKPIRSFLALTIIGIAVCIWTIWNQNYRKRSFKESIYTWAIIDEIRVESKVQSVSFHFHTKKADRINIEITDPNNECLYGRKIGDTIFIRYAKSDNDVAEIVYCYWTEEVKEEMKKLNQQ